MNKKPAIQAPKKTESTEELLKRLRELAWTGQHARVIDLATQALSEFGKGGSPSAPTMKGSGGGRTTQAQMDLLDLSAESCIAQGKFELAAKDAQAMLKIANAEKKPAFKAQALNRKALMQMRQGDLPGALKTATLAVRQARLAGTAGGIHCSVPACCAWGKPSSVSGRPKAPSKRPIK